MIEGGTMPGKKPVKIISDAPEADNVYFGFDAYARTIAKVVSNKENKTPMVIGIYGSWGSGKTTLMEQVMRYLDGDEYRDEEAFRACKTVWFEAWKYKDEDEILAALIETICKRMKGDNFFEKIKVHAEEFFQRFRFSKVISEFARCVPGVDVDISEFFADLQHKDKLGFYDTFQELFDRFLWTYLNMRPQFASDKEPDDSKGALVVFIDDLDRCPKSKVLQVLETIKLFMDKKGCIFVIGAAEEVIQQALSLRYEGDDANKFMEKIVQVTFKLPPLPVDDFTDYVKYISPGMETDFKNHEKLLMPALGNNPRRLKRFLNDLSLREGILDSKNLSIDRKHVFYWCIIELTEPRLADRIRGDRKIVGLLKKYINDIEAQYSQEGLSEMAADVLEKAQVPRSLHDYLMKKDLVKILGDFDVD